MSVLFSPVGTADPLTMLGDGPLINIVRHYDPDEIVLFMSPAMAQHQHDDQRYTRAIELISSLCDRRSPHVTIHESTYPHVHRFDHYIEEFEGILNALEKDRPNESILVNVSSGTPGMAQALVALGAFGRLNLTLLQVTTPRDDVNRKSDREDPNNYDLDNLWELMASDKEGSRNRITIVESPNFGDRLLRDNAIALINQCEYKAAYEIASSMRHVNQEALQLTNAAAYRLELNSKLGSQGFKGELSYKSDSLLEYLWAMEARLQQGHWAEFVRSMTPALTALMKRFLAQYLKEEDFLVARNGEITERIDGEKIRSNPKLCHAFEGENVHLENNPYITNHHLVLLIQEYATDDSVLADIKSLRSFEQNCRNDVAHGLTMSSKEYLEKRGGMSLKKIMDLMFRVFSSLGPAPSRNLYGRINQIITELL